MSRAVTSAVVFFLTLPPLAAEPVKLFNGKDLTGWEGDVKKTWRVEEGAIVGGSLEEKVPRNEFLCTTKTYGDFELKVKFKLLGDKKTANAGVQFRTKRIPKHHEVSGYQADVGQDYWGALYDESRRNKVLAGPKKEDLAKIVKYEDWNEYVIRCEGSRIRLWLNGTLTVDYTEMDEKVELRVKQVEQENTERMQHTISAVMPIVDGHTKRASAVDARELGISGQRWGGWVAIGVAVIGVVAAVLEAVVSHMK